MGFTRMPLDQYRKNSDVEDWINNSTMTSAQARHELNSEQHYRQRPRQMESWGASGPPSPQIRQMMSGGVNSTSVGPMNYVSPSSFRAIAPPPITTTNLGSSPTLQQQDEPISSASPWGAFTFNHRRQYGGSDENLRGTANYYNNVTTPSITSPLSQIRTNGERSPSSEIREPDYTTEMSYSQESGPAKGRSGSKRTGSFSATRGREILSSMFSSKPSVSSLSSAASRDRRSQSRHRGQAEDQVDTNNTKIDVEINTAVPNPRNPEHRNTIPTMSQPQQSHSAPRSEAIGTAAPSRSSMPHGIPGSILTSRHSASSMAATLGSRSKITSAPAPIHPQTIRSSRTPISRCHTPIEYTSNPGIPSKTSFPTMMPHMSSRPMPSPISMPPVAMSGFQHLNAPIMSPMAVYTPLTPGIPSPMAARPDTTTSQGPTMWLASPNAQTPGGIGLVPLNPTSMTMCTGPGVRDYLSRPESTAIPLEFIRNLHGVEIEI